MRQSQLNDHGQPFSKKQRKASRHMMAMRRGNYFNRAPGTGKEFKADPGLLAQFMGLLMGIKGLRRRKV